MERITSFCANFLDMFVDMSLYILIGLLCVGLLHVFVKKESILRHLGARRFSSVVKASVVGVPLPLCSCGVVPTAVELKKDGASNGAVVSFLVSTPQTGVDSIFATYSLMGLVMAIFRPIAAFTSGIIAGSIVNLFAKDDQGDLTVAVPSCGCGCEAEHAHAHEHAHAEAASCGCGCETEHAHAETAHACCEHAHTETPSCSPTCGCGHSTPTSGNKLLDVFRYAFGDFLDEISVHFVVGMLIAAAITTFLPADFFVTLGLHKGLLSMLAMVLIGLPMYICSVSSIPIALSLMTRGLSLGGGFVFLFTGPVTNIASILVLSKALGKKITGLYVASVIVCSLIFGTLLDFAADTLGLTITAGSGTATHGEAGALTIAAALFFAALILKGLYRNAAAKFGKK